MAEIAVVKFGGTSVSTEEARARAVKQVLKLREEGYSVVTVVSAMGRMGAPYATDTLLSLIDDSAEADTHDLLISCGETISACVFAQALKKAGCPASPLTGAQAGIITDESFSNSNVLGMDTLRVKSLINDGIVPVITGFQGCTASGRITTMGRGGSDTSAVEIGAYINAESVHIFTDVPGVAKMDPRIYSDVSWLKSVSYDSMLALSEWGAGVVHPRAVKAAKKAGVRVYVRSTFEDGMGTLLCSEADEDDFVGIAVKKNCGIETDKGAAFAVEKAGSCVISIMCSEDKLPDGYGFVRGKAGLWHLCVPEDEVKETAKALYLCMDVRAD